jgi:hypothetical protein
MKHLNSFNNFLLESNTIRIDMSVEETFKFLYNLIYNSPNFGMVKFIDLYPGYSIDKEGEIYYYYSKEEAINNVKSVINLFNSFPNKIKVYRTISVDDVEMIRYGNKLGSHWTFDKETAIEFSKVFVGNTVLTGIVDEKWVDWQMSYKAYFEFSNGAYKRLYGTDFNENELYIPNPKYIKNISYFRIGK